MKNFFLVIPTRDRLTYLSDLLLDLNAFKEYISQVIIIDQSSVSIKSEVEKLPLNYSFEFVESDRANSVNHSRNLALKYYKEEEWLFFLDDDLRISPIAFQKIIENLKSNIIDVLIPGIQFEEMDKEFRYHSVLDTIAKPNIFSKPRFRLQVCSGLNIVKSKVFKDAGFLFDEKFTIWGDDWDYGMRLLQAGAMIYYQPDILVEHLGAPSGGQRDKGKTLNIELEKQKLYFYFYKKHFTDQVVKQEYYIALINGFNYFLKTGNLSKLRNSYKSYRLAKAIK
jgi:GT2 family glycosyltransferase